MKSGVLCRWWNVKGFQRESAMGWKCLCPWCSLLHGAIFECMGRFQSDNPGELIREARLDLGITQTELARRAGLSQSSLAQMESGKRNVSPEMLERVLKAADYRPSLALEMAFERIRDEADRLGLRNLRVFGSVASGDDGFDSDIDFLVTADEEVDLFDLALFGERVRQITGFPADVIVDDGPIPPGWEALREAVPV